MRRSKAYRVALVVLSAWLSLTALLSCGYKFRGTGEPIGVQIESLSIPLMTSTSSFLGFEGAFTRIIRDEFVSHAKVPLVSSDTAQTLLLGEVYDIRTEPLSYRLTRNKIDGRVVTYEQTNTRRLRIRLRVKLVDRVTGKNIWEDPSMEEKETFRVGTDPMANRYYQRKALEEMARRLAKRIYMKTMERF